MASTSTAGGELRTNAVLTTADGRQINLGQIDRRVGIKIDLFGKQMSLMFPWTPRLWFYKYVTYRLRSRKQNINKNKE